MASDWQSSFRPRRSARVGLVFANVFFGIIPGIAFFAWIERNCAFPPALAEFGWESLYVISLWNVGLFLAFGVLHSLFAQPFIHRGLERVIPPQAVRTFYL